jgi:ribonuclease M5
MRRRSIAPLFYAIIIHQLRFAVKCDIIYFSEVIFLHKIKEIIIVEGLHDKIRLGQLIDTVIITTDGFQIYKNREKIALIKRLGEECGVIVLTDSDSAGARIRGFLKNTLHLQNIKQIYIPQIKGKEHRKDKPSKEGFLGVEGINGDVLVDLILQSAHIDNKNAPKITKLDFFEYGLSGNSNSGTLRRRLCEKINLPPKISSVALLDAVNSLYTPAEFTELFGEDGELLE